MIRQRTLWLAGALLASAAAHAGPNAVPGTEHHAFHEALSMSIEGVGEIGRAHV